MRASRASILHLAVSANEIPRQRVPRGLWVMHRRWLTRHPPSPPSGRTAAACPRARRNLLDNIFARIAVISISFGAGGGFRPDYPIIQIPLSHGRRA